MEDPVDPHGAAETERREVAINYRFPWSLHARAKSLAAWKGQTLRAWLTQAIEATVEQQEPERAEAERQQRHRRR